MADPISAPCHRDYYPAFRSSGQRRADEIRLILLHSTEGGTAKSVARYFQGPFEDDEGGSTHLVVDDVECQRCLADTAVPWGAKGTNLGGFHIEQCGFAKWGLVLWRKHLRTIKRAAWKTAYHCRRFDIPPVFLKAADLKAGKTGITTHAEASKAFGGIHWDPGPGWPRFLFMALVRRYLKEMQR